MFKIITALFAICVAVTAVVIVYRGIIDSAPMQALQRVSHQEAR